MRWGEVGWGGVGVGWGWWDGLGLHEVELWADRSRAGQGILGWSGTGRGGADQMGMGGGMGWDGMA